MRRPTSPTASETEHSRSHTDTLVRAIQAHHGSDDELRLALDRAVEVASYVAGMPMAAVHLLDDTLAHRLAAVGLDLSPTARRDILCRVAVDADQAVSTSDASGDERFMASPAVSGEHPVRGYSAQPLRTRAGEVIGTLCVIDTEVHELEARALEILEIIAAQVTSALEAVSHAAALSWSAHHDPLTGLGNRALLEERLSHVLERRSRRAGEPGVILLDLNGFKPVNDEHGHSVGDEVLVEVAERLRRTVRTSDTLVRLGGDEFVVVLEELRPAGIEGEEEAGWLPADAESQLRVVMERLGEVFVEEFQTRAGAVRVGASIGGVCAAEDEDAASLVRRADEAMYEVKRKHGDQR